MPQKKLVILSQVFVPDPAAVGQYMTEVAVAMAGRGHRVKVYASARGYDDPARRYPVRENLRGVDVRRLDFASFGKKSILTRIAGTASFMLQVLLRLLTERDLGAIFFSTSPPMVGLIATLVGRLRGVPVAYWAMDLNPDQLIALGKLKPADPAARALELVNRFILRRARLVIALDRFMASRLEARVPLNGRLLVLPPWPLEEHLQGAGDVAPWPSQRDANPFRQEHGLSGRRVVMYSGNHSPSNPLDTLLKASLAFKDEPRLAFAFVGGGIAKKDVESHVATHGVTNVLSIPYQPIERLRYSIAAADVHVASLGEPMVGIIHPCKVYGAMAVGRPVLYLGPSPSHISELIDRHQIGWHRRHGDVEGMVAVLKQILETSDDDLSAMGVTARRVIADGLSEKALIGQLCGRLERALKLRSRHS